MEIATFARSIVNMYTSKPVYRLVVAYQRLVRREVMTSGQRTAGGAPLPPVMFAQCRDAVVRNA